MIPATITHPLESLEGSSFTNRSRRTSQCLPPPPSLLRQEDGEIAEPLKCALPLKA